MNKMNEHPSLTRIEPPTKPLVDKKEVSEMARKYLLQEIDHELAKLSEADTINRRILFELQNISTKIGELQQTSSKNDELKREVLIKLKNKLEEK